MKKITVVIIMTMVMAMLPLRAQVSHGGTPMYNHSGAKVSVATAWLPAIDNDRCLQEDMDATCGAGPMRVAVNHQCNIDLFKDASVSKDADGTHYLMAINSPEATYMALHFSEFQLPEGATLFIYDESGEFVLGSFNATDVLNDGTFYTQFIPGSRVYVECHLPAGMDEGRVVINWVSHGYKPLFKSIDAMYDAESDALKGPHGTAEGACHINVVCPEGDDWRDQIRSAVAIQMNAGYAVYMCSGSVINNARQDRTPYVLSAYHCQDIDGLSGFVTYFLYQTNTCNGTNGPYTRSVSGAEIVAKYTYNGGSDFMLLRLSRDIPDSYKPYYAGWDWSVKATQTPGVCIHHPGGDYKKISFAKSIVRLTGNYANFYNVSWYLGSQNKGVTEEGSSGSPIYNSDKRIVGQLYAGSSACDNMGGTDLYGRLSTSRNGNNTPTGSLSPWLDPDNTGITTLDGLNYMDDTTTTEGITTVENGMQELTVYPNPSSGMVYFDVNAMGNANYKVFDAMGRCVKEGRTVLTATNQAINLIGLPVGTYRLQLYTTSRNYSAKVIIR